MLHMRILDAQALTQNLRDRFGSDLVSYLSKPTIADEVERRVLRQFVEALLFEGIVTYSSMPRSDSDISADADAVFDSLFSFSIADQVFRCIGSVRVFERVRIAQGTIQLLVGDNYREVRLDELIAALDIEADAKQRLFAELMQTVAFCRWNEHTLAHHLTSRRELSFTELESAITEGHLYHPCFKTRSGFSLADHQNYGPEAGQSFQFCWLAIVDTQLDRSLTDSDEKFWRREIGDDVFEQLSKRLAERSPQLNGAKRSGDWKSYALAPIHPWQLKALKHQGLAEALATGEIIELGVAGDYYQASQSLRTLLNVSHKRKANIKVPLNIISSSAHRNLQQHFVCTAAAISTWLQDLVKNDAYLQQKNCLILLSEYAGLLYEPSNRSLRQQMDGRVGAIFRESVLDKLEVGQQVLPFSALMLTESDGRPFIANWLDRYGLEQWLEQLLDTMLLPLWHMLVHHGVAFEAHAQNLLLIHQDGWPEKIVLRDFHEDIEYVESYLNDPGNTPKLSEVDSYFEHIAADEGFSKSSVESLREMVMDTVFVFNLADLSFLLERFYHYSEADFWRFLCRKLADYQALGITEKSRIDLLRAFDQKIMVESLLKKKIMDGGPLELFEHRVQNQLYLSSLSLQLPQSN
ncbi:IucA/IucC family protein [Agaribacterium haliotis]|uniref:IucA/IucC family protein n=1 Tax=Agaribacterium haliotis TaxID=2013869 RepID=UPI00130470BC|nr:IucA/IucC family protein [Agaribacterium haliotis]